ncbi:hypothetical protein R6Q57_016055 [Mikania cordata]
MGFFPLESESDRRYVGIWYAMDPKTVVWVANRDEPLPDSSGVLTVTEDGEINVQDKDQKVYFNTTTDGAPSKALKLLDSGNAVLIDTVSGSKLWESFLHPTDTFLPGMKMDLNLELTSWKNVSDPSQGSFMLRQEDNHYVIINNDKATQHWKSGSGSMMNFDPEPLFSRAYDLLTNKTQCELNQSSLYRNFSCIDDPAKSFFHGSYSRLLLNSTGYLNFFSWSQDSEEWDLSWHVPINECGIYGECGKFSLCSITSSPKCSCLSGFQPISQGDIKAGCKRTHDLSCTHDAFKYVPMIKVENPSDPFLYTKNESDCRNRCKDNCNCVAYSYKPAKEESFSNRSGRLDGKNSCWIWDSDLNTLQANGTRNISFRVAPEYLIQAKGSSGKNSTSFLTKTRILIFTMTVLLVLLLVSLGYIYYKRLVNPEKGSVPQMHDNERWAIELLEPDPSRKEDTESIGVPFFQLECILAATDNFSEANKLGRGGFGPVYKGKLSGGKEVAVKRLSSVSVQGLEEFRNEVMLIAKLQHRNLVRLLGYCMKGNEKILLYEYMPNKSLDAFIFDGEPRILLDWEKRFEIIKGIARGLLYLHQDSRLRIIHRDLKTSNILLDEELNPKISDFGLAKIVQGTEMEATTNRIVGTYGYMAPEYALEGFFSIKSDVFSFGVVILEIISGRKNTGTHKSQQNLSLLAHAWNLWKEDMPSELMDQRLLQSSISIEVLKCIIVGLLCVQEDPGDRPNMSNVVLMLAGDISTLPNPKQPAFASRKTMSSSTSSSYKPEEITVTLLEGR